MDIRIDLIKSFLKELKKVRSDILFTVSYIEQEDRFFVYHSYANIHEDKNYRIALNRLYTKFFTLNQVFSVSILLDRTLSDFSFIAGKILSYNENAKFTLDPLIINTRQTELFSTDFTERDAHLPASQPDYKIKKTKNQIDMELAA